MSNADASLSLSWARLGLCFGTIRVTKARGEICTGLQSHCELFSIFDIQGKFLTPRKTCGFILRIQISKSDIWQVAASTLIGYVWSLTLLSGEKIVRNHHERRVYICMYIYRPQGDQNADEDEEKASTASAKARRNDAELNGSRSWPSPR
ncbi:uncharacterized protein LOC105257552 isoform X1 [Camponotus floridanus]|uniref:uncharacterized protein LOC105257552 isoform X1 n=1 Tax=Camponotus floridanus TaxID=104421 RepID=UPI000DC6AA23|nr:uncharacterized protein LOC105257552 isoform X1 [Camponotus floridanus]